MAGDNEFERIDPLSDTRYAKNEKAAPGTPGFGEGVVFSCRLRSSQDAQ